MRSNSCFEKTIYKEVYATPGVIDQKCHPSPIWETGGRLKRAKNKFSCIYIHDFCFFKEISLLKNVHDKISYKEALLRFFNDISELNNVLTPLTSEGSVWGGHVFRFVEVLDYKPAMLISVFIVYTYYNCSTGT